MDAIKVYEEACRKVDNDEITAGEFLELIRPLRDVEVIKHGKFVAQYQYILCSECKYQLKLDWKYCPNCGARIE